MWRIMWAPNYTNKWQLEFNSASEVLLPSVTRYVRTVTDAINKAQKNLYCGVHICPSVRFWPNSWTNILQNFLEIWRSRSFQSVLHQLWYSRKSNLWQSCFTEWWEGIPIRTFHISLPIVVRLGVEFFPAWRYQTVSVLIISTEERRGNFILIFYMFRPIRIQFETVDFFHTFTEWEFRDNFDVQLIVHREKFL